MWITCSCRQDTPDYEKVGNRQKEARSLDRAIEGIEATGGKRKEVGGSQKETATNRIETLRTVAPSAHSFSIDAFSYCSNRKKVHIL